MRSVRNPALVVAVPAMLGIAALSWLYFAFWSRDEQPQGATLVHSVTQSLHR